MALPQFRVLLYETKTQFQAKFGDNSYVLRKYLLK